MTPELRYTDPEVDLRYEYRRVPTLVDSDRADDLGEIAQIAIRRALHAEARLARLEKALRDLTAVLGETP